MRPQENFKFLLGLDRKSLNCSLWRFLHWFSSSFSIVLWVHWHKTEAICFSGKFSEVTGMKNGKDRILTTFISPFCKSLCSIIWNLDLLMKQFRIRAYMYVWSAFTYTIFVWLYLPCRGPRKPLLVDSVTQNIKRCHTPRSKQSWELGGETCLLSQENLGKITKTYEAE